MAKIQLNGKKITIKSKSSVLDILKRYKLDSRKLAIEYNGFILPRANFKKKILKENDKLEVVHFIGGG
mgnify:FL=1